MRDQGQSSRCVAFAWTNFLSTTPIKTSAKKLVSDPPIDALYARAQQLDEWPGESYNGTSVRGGAKAMQERGLIGEYLWGTTVEELRSFVVTRGSVVFGSDWHEEMFYPEQHNGYVVVEGALVGGHAYLIIGYNAPRDEFVILNSWGKEWGVGGTAKIKASEIEKLLGAGAEMCTAIETRPAKVHSTGSIA